MEIRGWEMVAVGDPLQPAIRRFEGLDEAQVLVQVAGCGVCHTDLGFLDHGVPTRHPPPLILGHEISGTVVDAGTGVREWIGKDVVVPAVIPCGSCALCKKGRGSICPKQIFPGNDLDGGFATHVVVPANGLCPVPSLEDAPVELVDLAVVADAVTTPYQAIIRSGLEAGDLAVFVGIGGVGGFGVQIAHAMGAKVVAIDVDKPRLERIAEYGADLVIDSSQTDDRALKKQIRSFAKEHGLAPVEWKVFETSGIPEGQKTAFALLVHGGYLGIVGYTPARVEVCLSHLMAFDARAEGSWGCIPEYYPAALDLVLQGKVQLGPFVDRRPLATINDTFEAIRSHAVRERVVLVPELG
ncbi:MAG: 6-hydroxycyclohex-1-ene-1-carbonyl-CoA dehydrogenase [Planctomycetota bacterium]|jgi:6-hydroxycyclohex-1-ene-1-carbonyl-CoA dehydrogenase